MDFNKKDKVTILLNLLNERYAVAHQMRERTLKFAIWILGFIIIAIPWLITQEGMLTLCTKWAFAILLIILCIITFWFLRSIQLGFKKNRECIIKIEEALGLYESGLFIKSKQLLPEEYKDLKATLRSHFALIYLWIFVATIITVFFVWFEP